MLTGLDRTARAAGLQFMTERSRITSDHLSFNLVNGAWTETLGWSGQHQANPVRLSLTWLAQPILGWHTAVLLAAAGLVLLVGYGRTRRRSSGEPLAPFFLAVAVSAFGAVALALLVLELSTRIGIYDPRPAIAVFLALALG